MERRKLMASGATSAGVAVAGCLQWLLNGDDSETRGSTVSLDLGTYEEGMFDADPHEDYGYDDDDEIPLVREVEQDTGPEERSRPLGERTDRKMRLRAADLRYSFEIGSDDEEGPATVDLRISNDANHARRLTFDGYVPFTSPWPTWSDSGGDDPLRDLVLLPDYDPSGLALHVVEDVPGYVEEGEYWIPKAPPEPRERSVTVTLEPGEEIGGQHVLLASPYEAQRSSHGFPSGGRFIFESNVTVTSVDDSHEDPFKFEYGFMVLRSAVSP